MTAVTARPPLTASPLTRRGGRLRRRLARLERPLLLAGLALITAHLLDLAAVPIVAMLAVLPFAIALLTTHAPRWAIQESSLGIPHEEVRIATADGRELSGWYVPSRNRAAVVLSHGSGGSRERVAVHVRMLARNGYGVLALDNPGNGESEGHSNGLGANAQPGVDEHADASVTERVVAQLGLQVGRGISGMRPAPSLYGIMPRIAPRPVLLVAGGAVDAEVLTNRRYRDAGGSTTELWTVPGAGHTAGLRSRPVEYERRTIEFLDRALEVGRNGSEAT